MGSTPIGDNPARTPTPVDRNDDLDVQRPSDVSGGVGDRDTLTTGRYQDNLEAYRQAATEMMADDALDLPPGRFSGDPSVMDGMIVRMLMMYSDTETERFQGNIDQLDATNKMIDSNQKEKMDAFAEQMKAHAQLDETDNTSTILAGVGIGLAGLLLVSSLGTASGASLALTCVCAAAMIASSTMELTDAYSDMSGDAATGVRCGLAAVGVIAALGTGGLSLLSSINATAESTAAVGEAAADAAVAGSDATTSGEAADALVSATMRGMQATEGSATASAEVATDVDIASEAVQIADTTSGEGLAAAGDGMMEASSSAEAVGGAEGAETATTTAAEEAAIEEAAAEAADESASGWQTAATTTIRGARIADTADKIAQAGVDIKRAGIQRDLSRVQARQTDLEGRAQFLDSLREQITDTVNKIAEEKNEAARAILKAMVEAQQANATVARNMKV